MTNISPHIAPVYWIVLLFFITVVTWKTLELGGVMFIYMLLTIWEGENATHLLLVCQMLALAILSKVWVETDKSLEGLKLQEKLPRELLASGKTPNLWVQCSGSSCRKKYPYLLVWDRTVFKSSKTSILIILWTVCVFIDYVFTIFSLVLWSFSHSCHTTISIALTLQCHVDIDLKKIDMPKLVRSRINISATLYFTQVHNL